MRNHRPEQQRGVCRSWSERIQAGLSSIALGIAKRWASNHLNAIIKYTTFGGLRCSKALLYADYNEQEKPLAQAGTRVQPNLIWWQH